MFEHTTNRTDYQPGGINTASTRKSIRYAVIVPIDLVQEQGEVRIGGYFDSTTVTLIVDSKDLGTHVPTLKGHVEYNSQRYKISRIIKTEDNTSYLITLTHVEGSEVVS